MRCEAVRILVEQVRTRRKQAVVEGACEQKLDVESFAVKGDPRDFSIAEPGDVVPEGFEQRPFFAGDCSEIRFRRVNTP